MNDHVLPWPLDSDFSSSMFYVKMHIGKKKKKKKEGGGVVNLWL